MAKNVKAIETPTQEGALTGALIGEFVKARRTQLGTTIEEAASMCNVAKDTLSKIENARGTVQLESVLQVCKMLGIEIMIRPWDT